MASRCNTVLLALRESTRRAHLRPLSGHGAAQDSGAYVVAGVAPESWTPQGERSSYIAFKKKIF